MKAYHFCGPTLLDGRPIPPDAVAILGEVKALTEQAVRERLSR